MLLIPCPWCGARDEKEFENGGPARVPRPDPTAMTDEAWVDYLLIRPSHPGALRERWWHVHGCGQWFELWRDTVTHDFLDAPDER